MDSSEAIHLDAYAILAAAPDLYLILTPDFYIVDASNAYLKATLVTREQVVGRYIFDVFPDNPNDINATGVSNLRDSLTRVVNKKEPDAMAVQKYDIRRPNSTKEDFEVRYWSPLNTPVLDEHNNIRYIIHRAEDVTEQVLLKAAHDKQGQVIETLQSRDGVILSEILKRAKDIQALNKKLEESERFNIAFLKAIPDVMFLESPKGEIVFVNNQAEAMFGYAKTELIGKKVIDLLPDYLAIKQKLQQNTKDAAQHPIILTQEITALHKNTEVLSVEISVSPLKSEHGFCAIILIRDVTCRKKQANLLQEKEESLNELHHLVNQEKQHLEYLNNKMLITSELTETLLACKNIEEITDAFSVFANQVLNFTEGLLYLMHSSKKYLERKVIWGNMDSYPLLFSADECWALRQNAIHYVSEKKTGIICQHAKVIGKDKFGSICIPLITQNEVLGVLFILIESEEMLEQHSPLIPIISETIALAIANIRLKELLNSQSIRDPLTTLVNRHFLEEFIITQLGQAKRSNTSITFMMIDIDDFKDINNRYGRQAGDKVLEALGNFLRTIIRQGDLACRYGSEEFLLLLPNCEVEMAKVLAERIRKEVSRILINYNEVVFSVTISLGLSFYPSNGNSLKELAGAADLALCQAKKQGKNTYCVFTPQ